MEYKTVDDLVTYVESSAKAVATVGDISSLEEIRVAALGKNGVVTAYLKQLGQMSEDDRKSIGPAINENKQKLMSAIEQKKSELEIAELNKKLQTEKIDVTLPVAPEKTGRIHPISQTMDEVIHIFTTMGFTVAQGPDIETEDNNFTFVNIPAEHPARQMHDTFYLPNNMVLRTHTSAAQNNIMKNTPIPMRVIIPGRTYRCDSDATHAPMFHQIEGIVIDETSTFAHLKGTLITFLQQFFERGEVPTRFRPSFFPFTEPSAEVDIGCDKSGGELKIGVGNDWMEILGCGMIHPDVLKMANIDPEKYQGFAFGMGVERLAMLKYGVPDLRNFFENDVRFLNHYGFDPLDIPGGTS